jgi:VanZ family protein
MQFVFKYWFPVILWMVFIFWMSTDLFSSGNTTSIIKPVIQFLLPGITPAALDMIHAGIRKCGHIIEYFILGALLFRAFYGGAEGNKSWKPAIPSLTALILYAASDEYHQSFTSTRSASLIDVGIDAMGGMLAQIACIAWLFFKRKIPG